MRALIARVSGSGAPALASAHAHGCGGVDAVPLGPATLLSERFGLASGDVVVQSNVVSHASADGYGRLPRLLAARWRELTVEPEARDRPPRTADCGAGPGRPGRPRTT